MGLLLALGDCTGVKTIYTCYLNCVPERPKYFLR